MDKPQQALPFLLDLYNMYQIEPWHQPKFEVTKMLAYCLKKLYFSAYADSHADSITFNLEATVRSAFRTYLLLLLSSSLPSETDNESSIESYLNSMLELLKHYNLHGSQLKDVLAKLNIHLKDENQSVPLDQPLLVIHNSLSDFSQDICSSAASSSSSLNSSKAKLISESDESNSGSLEKVPQAKASSNTSLNSTGSNSSNNQFTSMSQQVDSFFCIKSVHCQQINLNNNSSSTPSTPVEGGSCLKSNGPNSSRRRNKNDKQNHAEQSGHSFIAGSFLKMNISVYSYLSVSVPITNMFATLDTSTSLVKVNNHSIGKNDERINSDFSWNSVDLSSKPSIQSSVVMRQYSGANVKVGVQCTNTEQIFKSKNAQLTGKFWPQLTISLLNQRLSNNEIIYKHHSFLATQHKFESNFQTEKIMHPGLNHFELTFQTPDNFNSNDRSSRCCGDKGIPCSHTNQIWFTLNQLVFICNLELNPFAIIESFNSLQNSTQCSFRLVKCPPTIELLPKSLLDEADCSNFDSFLTGMLNWYCFKLSSTFVYFKGIDSLVYLRLNSGTNVLAKGMRFKVVLDPTNRSNNESRCVTVSLTVLEEDSKVFDNFSLDRQVEPFETYQIPLRLSSSFNKPQVLTVNSTPQHDKKGQFLNAWESRDYMLTLSWSESDNLGTFTRQVACEFFLKDPFTITSKLQTCIDHKYLQMNIRGSDQLVNMVEALHLTYPQLSCVSTSTNGEPSFNLLPLNRSSSQKTFPLMSNHELNFVWKLVSNFETGNDTNNAKLMSKQTHRIHLQLSYAACGQSVRCIPYEIHILHDYDTRYLIRQQIESYAINGNVASNSEILKVGNPYLFKAIIEQNQNGEEYTADQSLMYEIMYNPKHWLFVKNSDKDEAKEEDNDKLTAKRKLSNNITNPVSTSQVILFNKQTSRHELAFEVMPLIAGNLTVPTIRLYRYVNTESTANHQQSNTLEVPHKQSSNWSSKIMNHLPSATELASSILPSSPRAQRKPIVVKNPTSQSDYNSNALTSKLVSFEPGQVYNYNRSSYIFVLPPSAATGEIVNAG